VSAVGITNKVFAVDAKATPAAARARRGTTFVYTLSEAATATVAIEQLQAGRRNGRSCVKPTTKTSKAKKCTRLASIGAIGGPGVAGPNALPFSGRIGTKALKPGSYRAVFVAVDASGNRSQLKTIAFKVVRR
jgi:hypothetical protein